MSDQTTMPIRIERFSRLRSAEDIQEAVSERGQVFVRFLDHHEVPDRLKYKNAIDLTRCAWIRDDSPEGERMTGILLDSQTKSPSAD